MLVDLKKIQFVNSGYTGTVCTEVGLMHSLEHLSIGLNSMSGRLPTELGISVNMTTLSVGSSQVTGSMPMELLLLNSFDSVGSLW